MTARKDFAPLAPLVMMFVIMIFARLQNVVSADAIYLSSILILGFSMLHVQLANNGRRNND